MEVLQFFTRAVPCKKKLVQKNTTPYTGIEEYSIVDNSLFRIAPNGILAMSGNDINRVAYLDKELFDFIDKPSFSLCGLPSYIVDELKRMRLIQGKKENSSYQKTYAVDLSLPYFARLEITDSCQCQCSFCYKKEKPEPNPSLETLKKRIKHLKKLGIVRLEILGGEAFLRKDLFELCDFISKEKLIYTIITNGEFIKDLDANQLRSLKTANEIIISLDSYGQHHDEGRRRKGLFEAIVQGFGVLKEHGIKFSVLSTVNSGNIKGVETLIDFLRPYEMPIAVRPTILAGYAQDNNIQNTRLDLIWERNKSNPYLKHAALYLGQNISEARYYGCDICYLINIDTKGQLLDCVMDRGSHFKNIEEYTPYSLKQELNNIILNRLNTQENCRECDVNQKGKDIRCSGFCKFSRTFIRQQAREKD